MTSSSSGCTMWRWGVSRRPAFNRVTRRFSARSLAVRAFPRSGASVTLQPLLVSLPSGQSPLPPHVEHDRNRTAIEGEKKMKGVACTDASETSTDCATVVVRKRHSSFSPSRYFEDCVFVGSHRAGNSSLKA